MIGVVARLVDDVPVQDPGGFRALLNSFLPRKRGIGQMLIRDSAGGPGDPEPRVLMCNLTYKTDWDLPGGVVDAVDDGSTGILVEGTRADDIAQAIEKLLSDGALAKRMGAAGREKVVRNGWDWKAGQYGRMIDRLAGGGADRSARPPAGPGQSAR